MTNWGNTSKNCASIPQDTAKHNRQELVAFCQLQCQECWYFTYFNHNSSTLELMTKIKIDACRTASGTQGRLRGVFTNQEIRKYNKYCLKLGKALGTRQVPQRALEDYINGGIFDHASAGEWNTDTTRVIHRHSLPESSTMNGTISQLHKGGSTNKMSDQKPVGKPEVLLNSVYQLLN